VHSANRKNLVRKIGQKRRSIQISLSRQHPVTVTRSIPPETTTNTLNSENSTHNSNENKNTIIEIERECVCIRLGIREKSGMESVVEGLVSGNGD